MHIYHISFSLLKIPHCHSQEQLDIDILFLWPLFLKHKRFYVSNPWTIFHGISVYSAFCFQAMFGGKKTAMISGKPKVFFNYPEWVLGDSGGHHSAPLNLDNCSAWQQLLWLGFYPLGCFWILCGCSHFLSHFYCLLQWVSMEFT